MQTVDRESDRWVQQPFRWHLGEGPAPLQDIWNLDGIAWHDAPLPRWFHKCAPQTYGFVSFGEVERCACGATRKPGWGRWVGKNETRSHRRRKGRSSSGE